MKRVQQPLSGVRREDELPPRVRFEGQRSSPWERQNLRRDQALPRAPPGLRPRSAPRGGGAVTVEGGGWPNLCAGEGMKLRREKKNYIPLCVLLRGTINSTPST